MYVMVHPWAHRAVIRKAVICPTQISVEGDGHCCHRPSSNLGNRWCQCPITSSLGEFPDNWNWLRYPGLSPVLVLIAFPFAFHISVFLHTLFFKCHWISFMFLLFDRRICTHSVDSSLTHIFR